ncbi:MAG: UDP-N-acetylmuramate dehydrogenase [Bacteroidia bacterium]
MDILKNHSLRSLNTFGIDSTALYFTEVSDLQEIREALTWSAGKRISNLILGGGSNLLFKTETLNYLVIKNNLTGITRIREDADHVFLKAGAGENWHKLVQYCVGLNYGGIENLSLIPGNVGAGPMQNIGAYGVELKDVFHELEAMNLADGTIEIFDNGRCRFGYRESIFKQEAKNLFVITSVTLRLNKKPVFNTQYGVIRQELDKMGVHELSVAAISEAVSSIRRSKLPDPAKIGNAGSFFKNPEIEASRYHKLKESFPDLIAYPLENGNFKLAAGWLIESCGWKGKSFGHAGVHAMQALVLVSDGKASGAEIYELSTRILTSVEEKFGVSLEREVNIIV